MIFKILNKAWLMIAGLFVLSACHDTEVVSIPKHFPALPIPQDNPITKEKVALGRRLFYEKGLSIDSSVSCGSCHIQAKAFTDTALYSVGALDSLGFRNTRGLTNTGYLTKFFGEAGLHTLERATIAPMDAEFEMNLNIKETLDRLNNNEVYAQMFQEAFGHAADHKSVLFALASFQRTMISGESRFDQFQNGDLSALSEDEMAGLKLFNSSRLNCAECHSGIFFTDEQTYNIGLYSINRDWGRGRLTLDSADHGAFLTPTLRNIEVTAPYMHDGSLKTLKEVIDFYESGGQSHYAKSDKMKAFKLSSLEKMQLVAFLKSLTDSTFITNPQFSDPNL